MGRPLVAPPGISEDRKEVPRQAFDATKADPEFITEGTARGLDLNPVKGAVLNCLLCELYATSAEVIAEVRDIIAEGAK